MPTSDRLGMRWQMIMTRAYADGRDLTAVGIVEPRAALEADEELPEGPEAKGVVHLVAAIGLGAQEVGADALAEAFAAYGKYGLTAEDWAQMLGAAERGEGPPIDWGLLQQHADIQGPVQRASAEELLRARTVLTGLRGFYALSMMHGCSCRTHRHSPRCGRRSTHAARAQSWSTASPSTPPPDSSPKASRSASNPSSTGSTRRSWNKSQKPPTCSAFPATRPAPPAS
ncbi:hypothetical protein ACFU7X_02605 [Streptomyces chartreusis]|uniref:hypothetical protein n=1 Tax=Streptomyces chartreusis TaxID=1969 RepID=UPI0036810825